MVSSRPECRVSLFRFLSDHLFVRFRRRRMKRFQELFALEDSAHVLDIGGTAQTWTQESGGEGSFRVTLLNRLDYGAPPESRFTAVMADAVDLPFADHSFTLAFSNSVIEHLQEFERQQAFAQEARRVAPKLWIQTPARCFPIEAHLLAPFVQFLPRTVQHRLARWTPRGLMQPEVVHQIVDEVRLLSYREMRALFPDCTILTERFLGLPKSYIAVRGGTGLTERA